MKRVLLTVFLVFAYTHIFSQVWQPMGIPEGSGVTDMVYWKGGSPFDDKLWVTTGSVNWPTGQRGGVFYSATTPPYQGIWYRLGGSAGYYIGRTLAVGQDGNLYASLWRDPANFPADALCRLSVQAATFGVLYQAQAGDNIFSIAVKNNPHTIFGGTRNGIIRSTNNGLSFGYSNTGIPDNAWVFDIAIDSTGILAIATSKGLFISSNNGDSWLVTTGIPSEDTVQVVEFFNGNNTTELINKSLSKIQNNKYLITGTNNGKIYKGGGKDNYTIFVLLYLLTPDQAIYDPIDFKQSTIRYLSTVSKNSNRNSIWRGQVYETTDEGLTWNELNNGLPPEPPVSSLAIKVINETSGRLYAGLFSDTTNGAGVYRLDVTVGVDEIDNKIPSEYFLSQNYPNPFNPSTTIQFSIPEQSFVRLEVFNTLGEIISTLVSEELNTGNYKYEWNAKNLSSGIYLYRLQIATFSTCKKMILIK